MKKASTERSLPQILKLPSITLEAIFKTKRKIERLNLQLDDLTKNGKAEAYRHKTKRRKRRPMSAESRKKIAAAAKARWARVKASKKT